MGGSASQQTNEKGRQVIFYCVDTETTGTDHARDRVVEFAAVPIRLVDGADLDVAGVNVEIGEGASELVYPGIPIPPEASAVHHLIDADVEGAMPLGRAVNHVLGPFWRVTDIIFAAHSARFDYHFLPMLQEHKWIDTYRAALHVWPDAPGFSNQVLRYWLGIDLPRNMPTHRALPDTIVTAHILVRLLQERSINNLIEISKKAVILKVCKFGNKHRGKLWTEVETDYLRWIVREKVDDRDVLFTAKFELARRSGALANSTEQGEMT